MMTRRSALMAATAAAAIGLATPVSATTAPAPARGPAPKLPRHKVELVSPPFAHAHEQVSRNGPRIMEFTLSIEEKYADLIHEDASMLLRPRTGLQDITVEVDAGSEGSPTVQEGATIPVSQTQPNVQPDEILASLDGDTQAYLDCIQRAQGATALQECQGLLQ